MVSHITKINSCLKISLDYICYLEDIWKSYLSKDYDSGNPEKRMVWEAMRDTIDDMKNNQKVGIMLYDFFKALESGDLRNYNQFFKSKK